MLDILQKEDQMSWETEPKNFEIPARTGIFFDYQVFAFFISIDCECVVCIAFLENTKLIKNERRLKKRTSMFQKLFYVATEKYTSVFSLHILYGWFDKKEIKNQTIKGTNTKLVRHCHSISPVEIENWANYDNSNSIVLHCCNDNSL